MDRAERISLAVATALGIAALGAWALERPPERPTPDPEELPEAVRTAPVRPPPEGPPLSPVGTTTLLPSGLEVTDQIVGTGRPLRAGQIAIVELTRWATADGRVVDSTAYLPGPTRIRLAPGEVGVLFEEGLDWMRVGGSRLLAAPHDLEPGVPGSVVAVDLLGVLDPPTPPPRVDLRDLGGFGVADLRTGDGPDVRDGSDAVLDYSVWLPGDPEPLDSSLYRVNPLTVRVGRDPLAWAPALVGMHAGGARLVRVPPALAFRTDRRPRALPDDAELFVEVQLHAVK